MQRPDWAPDAIDIERPSAARMYDYLLGGSDNFAVDREAARQVIELMPDMPLWARANRAFLRRAVRFLAGNDRAAVIQEDLRRPETIINNPRSASPVVSRGRAEVARFFEEFDLVEPGLVWAPPWRPDSPPADSEQSAVYAGVGRLRG